MGMLNGGLNLIRDLWSALLDAAELGTGTTYETAEDTDVETVISTSEITSISTTTSNQQVEKSATFPGTSSGGESVTEMIWKTNSVELAGSRVTINSAVTWTTGQDLIIDTRWYFKGRQG